MTEKLSRLERRVHKKSERETTIKMQRDAFQKRQQNKKIINYAIVAVVLIAIVYAVSVMIPKDDTGIYDDLAKCLTKQGLVMYGTDWCSHCQEQKRMFDGSFKYINYVNCDMNYDACKAAGVEGYPTWTYPKGPKTSGEQQLALLAERAGCTVPTGE